MKKKKYIILGTIICTILAVGITLAKYVTEDYHGYHIDAKEFSFTSNVLKENQYQSIYVIDKWPGVGTFDITFDLSSKKNNLYFNDYDVPYEVIASCPENVECTLDKDQGIIYANDPTHTDTITLHVRPLQEFVPGNMLTLSIGAKSLYPYEKELSASFTYFVTDKETSYKVTDYGPVYVKLTVTNAKNYYVALTNFDEYVEGDLIDIDIYNNLSEENKAKCRGAYVNISFNPSDLIIDTTDSIVGSHGYTTESVDGEPYVNSIVAEVAPMSSIDIKFYKKDPNVTYDSYTPAISVEEVISGGK